MPPHLHPRSRTTTSIFGITLAVSFLVVGMPHVLPCPAPRTTYAEAAGTTADGRPIRRRRRKAANATEEEGGQAPPNGVQQQGVEDSPPLLVMQKKDRECPVPKPTGLIGEVLGFGEKKKTTTSTTTTKEDKVVAAQDRR